MMVLMERVLIFRIRMPAAPAAAVAHLISNILPLRLPWDRQVLSIFAFNSLESAKWGISLQQP